MAKLHLKKNSLAECPPPKLNYESDVNQGQRNRDEHKAKVEMQKKRASKFRDRSHRQKENNLLLGQQASEVNDEAEPRRCDSKNSEGLGLKPRGVGVAVQLSRERVANHHSRELPELVSALDNQVRRGVRPPGMP